MTLLERLGQDLNPPPFREELMERLANPSLRDNFLYHVPDVTEHIPGFTEGRYMGPWERTNNPRNLDWRIVRGLLFANCGSYEEMKDKIYGDIRDLGENYAWRKPADFKNKEDKIRKGFDPEPVIDTLNLVEKAYHGKVRRSGEPEFAHVLRVVKRGLDFIRMNQDWYNNGRNLSEGELSIFKGMTGITPDFNWKQTGREMEPFNPLQAQYLLLMCALHDFFEDTREFEGQELPLGDIQFGMVKRKGTLSQTKFTIRRFGNPHLNENPLQIINDGSVSIEDDYDHIGYLVNGLDALSRDGDSSEEQFTRLSELAEKKRHEYRINELKVMIWYNLPFLTKVFDREDNMVTYLLGNKDIKWTWDQALFAVDATTDIHRFIPPKRDKVIEKCQETLKYLLHSEQIMGFSMSLKPWLKLGYIGNEDLTPYLITGVYNDLVNGKRFKKIHPAATYKPEAFFYKDIQRLRPSRMAAYYLMGYGLNDIFKHNEWDKEDCWLPEVL